MTRKDLKEEKPQSTGRREQHSGHGSLTKAGKVRGQTVKIEKTNLAKHKGPSTTNRKRWKKSLIVTKTTKRREEI